MKRNAWLFAVMLGLGVAGGAWAAPKSNGAVRTEKVVGPNIYDTAVRTQKAVGPEAFSAVRMEKAVPQEEKRAGQSAPLDLNAGF